MAIGARQRRGGRSGLGGNTGATTINNYYSVGGPKVGGGGSGRGSKADGYTKARHDAVITQLKETNSWGRKSFGQLEKLTASTLKYHELFLKDKAIKESKGKLFGGFGGKGKGDPLTEALKSHPVFKDFFGKGNKGPLQSFKRALGDFEATLNVIAPDLLSSVKDLYKTVKDLTRFTWPFIRAGWFLVKNIAKPFLAVGGATGRAAWAGTKALGRGAAATAGVGGRALADLFGVSNIGKSFKNLFGFGKGGAAGEARGAELDEEVKQSQIAMAGNIQIMTDLFTGDGAWVRIKNPDDLSGGGGGGAGGPKTWLEKLKDALGLGGGLAAGGIAAWLFRNLIKKPFKFAGKKLFDLARWGLGKAFQAGKWGFGKLLQGGKWGLGKLGEAAKWGLGKIVDLGKAGLSKLGQGAKWLGPKVMEGLKWGANKVLDLGRKAGPGLARGARWLIDKGKGLANRAAPYLDEAWDFTKEAFTKAAPKAGSALKFLYEGGKDLLGRAGGAIGRGASSLGGYVRGAWTKAGSAIRAVPKSPLAKLPQLLTRAWKGAMDTAKSGIAWFKGLNVKALEATLEASKAALTSVNSQIKALMDGAAKKGVNVAKFLAKSGGAITKFAAPVLLKFARFIPLIGFVIGCYEAYNYAVEGDWVRAGLSIAQGLLSFGGIIGAGVMLLIEGVKYYWDDIWAWIISTDGLYGRDPSEEARAGKIHENIRDRGLLPGEGLGGMARAFAEAEFNHGFGGMSGRDQSGVNFHPLDAAAAAAAASAPAPRVVNSGSAWLANDLGKRRLEMEGHLKRQRGKGAVGYGYTEGGSTEAEFLKNRAAFDAQNALVQASAGNKGDKDDRLLAAIYTLAESATAAAMRSGTAQPNLNLAVETSAQPLIGSLTTGL